MTIKEIIDKLCNHEISKAEAEKELNQLIGGLRQKGALEFTVTKVGFTVADNHGIVEMMLPYGYDRLEKTLQKGDKVDVVILP